MGVLDKCSQIEEEDPFNNNPSLDVHMWMFVSNNINSVFAACVKFIEWYNKQEKS